MEINVLGDRFAGYAHLLDRLELTAMHNWHISSVSATGSLRSKVQGRTIEEVYPAKYWPGDKIGDHLEFALKYDGVNLGALKLIVEHVGEDEIMDFYVKTRFPLRVLLPGIMWRCWDRKFITQSQWVRNPSGTGF